MSRRLAGLLLFATPLFCADWNPRLTADYLDARQKDWFAWPRANQSGAPCISCHTGLTYMLVRPDLRRALGEKQSTEYERGFSQTIRARVTKKVPSDAGALTGFSVDAVLSALLLAAEEAPSGKLSLEAQQAFDRMWATQSHDGSWPWYSLNDDPWEMPESGFFGASIAALAAGYAPAPYRERPEVNEHLAALKSYLSRSEAGQPFHNRLALLWASSKLPEVLSAPRRSAILQQARLSQQPDGAWTMASLGPWQAHPQAVASTGSNAYATAFTAFALEQGGVAPSDPMLARALDWLRAHQSSQGYWDAPSMNHKYEAGSMMELFMRDAATGFASLALLNAGESRVDHPSRP